jgi:hypothetical protein
MRIAGGVPDKKCRSQHLCSGSATADDKGVTKGMSDFEVRFTMLEQNGSNARPWLQQSQYCLRGKNDPAAITKIDDSLLIGICRIRPRTGMYLLTPISAGNHPYAPKNDCYGANPQPTPQRGAS